MAELACKRGTYVDRPEHRRHIKETGRAKVVPFFEEVVPQQGLEVEDIYEMDADGARRPWATERDGGTENIGERKKWLVVARLRRQRTT